ncbi:hypothetical protein Q1695_012835 [Nippostrongylus brasiliensis]|nr:hypothetical protein Q1695_012835 [Nippostrongylus brasiliensis]
MVSNGDMDFGRPDRSFCDDFMFASIPDDEENSSDGAADDINAVNDETFGGDVNVPIDSELEDYAAQTACLRLDDGAPWDVPGCSKAPAPDASTVPLPDFNVFGNSAFSSFGSETLAKLDSLWSQQSHNLYDLWDEQKSGTRSTSSTQPTFVQNSISKEQTSAPGFDLSATTPRVFTNSLSTAAGPSTSLQRSPVAHRMPPMPATDLERLHLQSANTCSAPVPNIMPPAAVNAADLERRFIEESAAVQPQSHPILPPSCSPRLAPTPSAHKQIPTRMPPPPPVPPGFGPVPPIPMSPLLPPLHPMMLPFVPIWLEHLAGRVPCLPPGCPPVPPLLHMFFDTVKDPRIVMEMLKSSQPGMVPPPFPLPPQGFDRRIPWQRKAPGMPSGRTIEDLAFDQFAGYMSCKEREWLVKIQILQCQGTGNPYENDYYYANWRDKQIAKGWRPREGYAQEIPSEKAKENERRLRRINGSRSHNDSPREPKEAVPLNVKFAGSLGLPSKSSTSNPRHLISVEHSLDNAEEDATQRAGKQRKLRTLLLRLESALTLLIECEDKRVQMRSSHGHNSEVLLAEISQRIEVIFQELMSEDLVKILQVGKGRQVVSRAISVGTPNYIARIVLSLFSVASLCPKKFIDEMSSDLVPPMFAGLMSLSREQLMALSSALNIDSLKENFSTKNTFGRDALLTLLLVCAKRKVTSQNVVRWLCGQSNNVDLVNGWSSPLTKWRELLPNVQNSDVQMFAEWLLLLCDNTHCNSLAKALAKTLLLC